MANKKLRVLYARFGKVADDVIIVDAATAETCVDIGWCDDAPAAVKFALSLGVEAQAFVLPDAVADAAAAEAATAEEGAAEEGASAEAATAEEGAAEEDTADQGAAEEGAAAEEVGAPSDAAE